MKLRSRIPITCVPGSCESSPKKAASALQAELGVGMLYMLSTSGKSLLGTGGAQLLSPSLLMMPRICDQSGGGGRGRSSSESRVLRYSSPGGAASPAGFQAVRLRGRPRGEEKAGDELSEKVHAPSAPGEWKEAPHLNH